MIRCCCYSRWLCVQIVSKPSVSCCCLCLLACIESAWRVRVGGGGGLASALIRGSWVSSKQANVLLLLLLLIGALVLSVLTISKSSKHSSSKGISAPML
jgi:hypothetical protein